jgi:hypothetical protein
VAYRKLEIGDDVKIVKCQEWSGQFGEVVGIEGQYIKVRFSSWRGEPSMTHYFTEDKLLVSTGNPYRNYSYEPDDDFEDFEVQTQYNDQTILQALIERVSKLEKELLNMKSQAA